ncbi:hypothetical protein HS088_TW12G00686 [Tripterygium wilfordii]|uniref:Uncharacterized protein n=1 Tax=Tripterygium wilfordii TaxID=458696 RepID=A0A7J7CZJ9_TRIWF|nr:hypothetical protein HS088_TW12G00686 [Tripterygium wilfordii]
MDISESQCNSGCDSGWTHYLDQSTYSKNRCHGFGGVDEAYRGGEGARMENDEEDDLSMVSDASSGPRHCDADHEECSGELDKRNKRYKKKKKVKSREHCRNQHQSSLDDTASSSVLGSPKASFWWKRMQVSQEMKIQWSIFWTLHKASLQQISGENLHSRISSDCFLRSKNRVVFEEGSHSDR